MLRSRAVPLAAARGDRSALPPSLSTPRCTQALEFLCLHDCFSLMDALRAVHQQSTSAAGTGAPAAAPYDVARLTAVVLQQFEAAQAALGLSGTSITVLSEPAAEAAEGRRDDASAAAAGAAAATARYEALLEVLLELHLRAERFEEALLLLLGQEQQQRQTAGIDGEGNAPHRAAGDRADASLRPSVVSRYSGRVFDIIADRGLHAAVAGKVAELLALDEARALQLIAGNLQQFPLEAVALQLQAAPARLLALLEHLFAERGDAYNAAPNAAFHDLHVQLCAQLAPGRLLPFLQHCRHYSAEAAQAVCRATVPPLHRELAFLLSRCGRGMEAMLLQLEELGDVAAAVETATAFNEEELWNALVRRTLQRAQERGDGELVGVLLDSIGGSPVSPLKLISALPAALPIPRLHARLAATIRGRRLHQRMVALCAAGCREDVMAMVTRLTEGGRAGMCMPGDAGCALCHAPLAAARAVTSSVAALASRAGGRAEEEDGEERTDGDRGGEADGDDANAAEEAAARQREAEDASKAVVFFCRHAFHYPCLRDFHAKALAAAAAAASAAAAATRSRSLSRVSSGGDLAASTSSFYRRRRGSSMSGELLGLGGSGASFTLGPEGLFGAVAGKALHGGGSRTPAGRGSAGGATPGSSRRRSLSMSLRWRDGGDDYEEGEDSSQEARTHHSAATATLGGLKKSQWSCPLCSSGVSAAPQPAAVVAAPLGGASSGTPATVRLAANRARRR
jgi:hypothetical protein